MPWVMLYGDDFVLTAELRAEVLERFGSWKDVMESKWLTLNIEKTNIFVTGIECEAVVSSGGTLVVSRSRAKLGPLYNKWKVDSHALLRTAKCHSRKIL